MPRDEIEALGKRIRRIRTDRRSDYLTDLELDNLCEDIKREAERRTVEDIERYSDVQEEIEALGLDPENVLQESAR